MLQVIRSFAARSYLLFFAILVTTALLLGTNQSFSASSLKLISPNGGQSYAVGQSVKIKWAKGNGGNVNTPIFLQRINRKLAEPSLL